MIDLNKGGGSFRGQGFWEDQNAFTQFLGDRVPGQIDPETGKIGPDTYASGSAFKTFNSGVTSATSIFNIINARKRLSLDKAKFAFMKGAYDQSLKDSRTSYNNDARIRNVNIHRANNKAATNTSNIAPGNTLKYKAL